MLDSRNNGLNAKQIIKNVEVNKRKRLLQSRKRLCTIVSFVAIASVSAINPYALSAQNQNNVQAEVRAEVQTTQEQPNNTSVALETVNTSIETVTKVVEKVQPVIEKVKEENSVKKDDGIYNKNIPMPRAHQEYLNKLCNERGLNYTNMLAIIKHESQFDSNCITNRDYGYFQVNTCNHTDLAKELKTENEALDPYININWGTYMMSGIYKKWINKGYSGEELDKVAWSEYNEGAYGLKKWGLANNYINKVNSEKRFIESVM